MERKGEKDEKKNQVACLLPCRVHDVYLASGSGGTGGRNHRAECYVKDEDYGFDD